MNNVIKVRSGALTVRQARALNAIVALYARTGEPVEIGTGRGERALAVRHHRGVNGLVRRGYVRVVQAYPLTVVPNEDG